MSKFSDLIPDIASPETLKRERRAQEVQEYLRLEQEPRPETVVMSPHLYKDLLELVKKDNTNHLDKYLKNASKVYEINE